MDFNDMRALAKRIDVQVESLETKLAHPMGMMYSNNSSQGVKVLSMLKDLIQDVDKKKKTIDHFIKEENLTWSGMVEDYNSVDKFKSEVVANLDKYENMWSSSSNYKPFISHEHGDLANEELDSLNNLNIQDHKQLTDQSLNESHNITMS